MLWLYLVWIYYTMLTHDHYRTVLFIILTACGIFVSKGKQKQQHIISIYNKQSFHMSKPFRNVRKCTYIQLTFMTRACCFVLFSYILSCFFSSYILHSCASIWFLNRWWNLKARFEGAICSIRYKSVLHWQITAINWCILTDHSVLSTEEGMFNYCFQFLWTTVEVLLLT